MNFDLDITFQTAYELLDKFPANFYGLVKSVNLINPSFSLKFHGYTFTVEAISDNLPTRNMFGVEDCAFHINIIDDNEHCSVFKIKFIYTTLGVIKIQQLLITSNTKIDEDFIINNQEEIIFPLGTNNYIYKNELYEETKNGELGLKIQNLLNLIKDKIHNNV